jgi:16S rRNA (uracil1498-N3)-methyltransferase
MQLFFTPDIDASASVYHLNAEESRHCVSVLRLAKGDVVELIDGRGNFYTALITEPSAKSTVLQITGHRSDQHKRNHYLHIAVAPTKNLDRLEWFLEKATEIGFDEISFIICTHSERKDVKIDRLNKIVVSAIKQSLKAWMPVLNEPVTFNKFISRQFDGQKFIAHCAPADKLNLKDALRLNGRCLVMIGPEGDFSSQEIESALENDFIAITLGDSRLRTETAALEACFEVNFLNR